MEEKIIKFRVEDITFGAIIEFSNKCSRNCAYCGLNTFVKDRNLYEMVPKQVVHLGNLAKSEGYTTVVLQSGEMPQDPQWLPNAIFYLKDLGLSVIVSTGEKDLDTYKDYKMCGANWVLLRIETTDKELYATHHPGHKVEERITASYHIKEAGLNLISGPLLGLPGMTDDIIAKDFDWLAEIKTDALVIGTFKPTPGTLLAGAAPEDPLEALKWQKKVRDKVNAKCIIPATSLGLENRIKSLELGGNIWLSSITPPNFSKDYNIFSGKSFADLPSLQSIKETLSNYL